MDDLEIIELYWERNERAIDETNTKYGRLLHKIFFSILSNHEGMENTQVLSEQSGNLYRLRYKDNEIGKLKIANSIWLGNKLNGGEVKADFMNQNMGSIGFSKGVNFTRSGLGLKNGGQMVFILPDEGITPYDLLVSPEQI